MYDLKKLVQPISLSRTQKSPVQHTMMHDQQPPSAEMIKELEAALPKMYSKLDYTVSEGGMLRLEKFTKTQLCADAGWISFTSSNPEEAVVFNMERVRTGTDYLIERFANVMPLSAFEPMIARIEEFEKEQKRRNGAALSVAVYKLSDIFK
jgi:hypothetical protein